MKNKYSIEILVDVKGWDELKIESSLDIFDFKVLGIKKIANRRSKSQNAALMRWLDQNATEANNKGLTMDNLILKPTEFSITKSMLLDFFRQAGYVMFKKDSTKNLDTKECSEVIELCKREFAKRLDNHIPFPNMIDKLNDEK